jgi:hypothetical protein
MSGGKSGGKQPQDTDLNYSSQTLQFFKMFLLTSSSVTVKSRASHGHVGNAGDKVKSWSKAFAPFLVVGPKAVATFLV